MAANRSLPVVEASGCPSSGGHSAPFCVPDVDMLGFPDQSLPDLLANLPDPPNPPDLSDHRSSRLGPTSPTQLASDGDDEVMPLSDIGQGPSVLRKGGISDSYDDNSDIVAASDDDNYALSRQDKGKAPETAYLLFASERGPNPESYRETAANLQQAPNPTEPLMEDKRLSNLIEIATNADDSESSSRTTQSGTEDASYPSSVFEEPQDHHPAATASASDAQAMSWKQKQKQKIDPEAETRPFPDASEEEKSFQPLRLGDPGWEKSAGRPPQKLPIRFRDAVGRNFLFPWEKAKTWAGMKGLVQSCFIHVDVVGPHVMAGRYDLSINLPFPMDSASEILSPGTPLSPGPSQASTSAAETLNSSAAAGSSSTPDASNGANSSQKQQPKSSFVVLPELWEDTIEPGMVVVQHMWPFQTPNYIAQPGQPTPPQPHYHGPPPPSTRGRGAAHGRGRGGAAMFGGRGGAGAGLFGTHAPHHVPRTPIIIVNDPPLRGKTRKRQDRRFLRVGLLMLPNCCLADPDIREDNPSTV
ncbi:hypothetical protein FHL15_005616 [Xylaria flabelliformis]|uniref:Ubiquitin-like domain-containing protein n=1 Tax=Xylaria flabelliformis TaxID=2512241 RepID=A0A553HZG9_9PEZI|nr:hypothetical protein FHL15_005616 [Xylaria flabelliformis]